MTPEILDAVWKIAACVFAAGGMWNELRQIRRDISRLEAKQDKYNHLQERMVRVEDSAKSAHRRLDILDGKEIGRG